MARAVRRRAPEFLTRPRAHEVERAKCRGRPASAPGRSARSPAPCHSRTGRSVASVLSGRTAGVARPAHPTNPPARSCRLEPGPAAPFRRARTEPPVRNGPGLAPPRPDAPLGERAKCPAVLSSSPLHSARSAGSTAARRGRQRPPPARRTGEVAGWARDVPRCSARSSTAAAAGRRRAAPRIATGALTVARGGRAGGRLRCSVSRTRAFRPLVRADAGRSRARCRLGDERAGTSGRVSSAPRHSARSSTRALAGAGRVVDPVTSGRERRVASAADRGIPPARPQRAGTGWMAGGTDWRPGAGLVDRHRASRGVLWGSRYAWSAVLSWMPSPWRCRASTAPVRLLRRNRTFGAPESSTALTVRGVPSGFGAAPTRTTFVPAVT